MLPSILSEESTFFLLFSRDPLLHFANYFPQKPGIWKMRKVSLTWKQTDMSMHWQQQYVSTRSPHKFKFGHPVYAKRHPILLGILMGIQLSQGNLFVTMYHYTGKCSKMEYPERLLYKIHFLQAPWT